MMDKDVQVVPTERKRGGCLTAALVVFGSLSLLAALANLGLSGRLASQLPNAPTWAPAGILGLGLLGLVAVAALVLIWRWQRAGLYLYIAVGVGVFALNVALVGVAMSLVGLTGVVIVSILVAQKWSEFS